MAYRKVSMIEIKEILLRIAKGQSKRKIRRDLSVHGLTINRYIEEAKCLGVNLEDCQVSQITDNLCSAIARNTTTKPKVLLAPRDVILLPVKDKIEAYLKEGITKTKIISLLGRDGIVVSESSFLRFVKSHFSHLAKNITVRLPETEPGQYAQADFARLGILWDEDTKKHRIAHAFIVTLAFSRLMFVYITFKQDTHAVIQGLELAWDYFEGIPKILIFDNLTPVVDKADRYSPRINKTFMEYAQFRGFIVDPANPAHPRGKAIVENNVAYVKKNFFAGKTFISRDDCQERAIDWCSSVAANRIHGTTRQRPLQLFKDLEKNKLTPYDNTRYDTPYWARPLVHTDHHVSFKKSLYSLPTKYIGKTVDVRGDSALVRIYFNDELIKTHPRMPEKKRSTDYSDYPEEITPYTLRNANYQISAGKAKHPAIGDYIAYLLSGTYPWHRIRSAQSLLRIADKYGFDRTAAACTKAFTHGIDDVRRIERMLKNGVEKDLPKNDDLTLFEEPARFASLVSYDWDTTTQYDRELVKKLFSLSFIEKKQSVLLFGPTGVGKTMLARHLAYAALKAGYSVLFTRADKMFDALKLSLLDGGHDRILRHYLKYDLLVIDDFAIRTLGRNEANDLYELIVERYELKSSIFTSARAPEEWQGLFPDPILGNSALDRLAHSSFQILMDGPSIRKQNSPK